MTGEENLDSGWRQRLDELECQEGEDFDRSAAFRKLSFPVIKKNKSYLMPLSWAAACALILAGLLVIFRPENKVHVRRAAQNPEMGEPVSQKQQSYDTVIFPGRIKKEVASTSPQRSKILHHTVRSMEVLSPDAASMVTKNKIIDTNSTNLFSLNALPVAAKKKMSVVYLNEIPTARGENVINSMQTRPIFPMRFYDRQTFTNNTGKHNSNADVLIKIALSTQN